MHNVGWGRQSLGEISVASSLFNTFIRNFQRERNTAIHGCICPLCNGDITTGA
jgi:hypothetical protein